ncbi:MAG: hypothetical protein Q9170_002310 [Blastenia crenularia]
MNCGYSIGHFLTLGQLAWSVYKSCKEAPTSFSNVSDEVLSLHAVINEFEENITNSALPSSQLQSLETSWYEEQADLGSSGMGERKHIRFEITADLKHHAAEYFHQVESVKITVHIRLQRYLDEYQKGHRDGSVVSSHSISSKDKVIWREIRKKLEEVGVGVTVAAFNSKKAFIVRWFKANVEAGAFEDRDETNKPNERAVSATVTDATSSDYGSGDGFVSSDFSEDNGDICLASDAERSSVDACTKYIQIRHWLLLE